MGRGRRGRKVNSAKQKKGHWDFDLNYYFHRERGAVDFFCDYAQGGGAEGVILVEEERKSWGRRGRGRKGVGLICDPPTCL